MGETLKISYIALQSASDEAKWTAGALISYREELGGTVCDRITALPGADAAGYASRASGLARRKQRELLLLKNRFNRLAKKLDRFRTMAEKTDKSLGLRFRLISGCCIGRRSLGKGASDRLYRTFCIALPGKFTVTKAIADAIRWAEAGRSSTEEDLKDWFCYKEGKYWGRIVKSVVTPVASAAGAAAAAGAISFGAPIVLIVTGAGALSAGTLALISAGNAGFSFAGNIQAIKSSREGRLGLARYQGSVNGFSDYVRTHDLGDEAENEAFAQAARTVGYVKKGAEAVSTVLGVVSLGAHTSSVTGKVDAYSVSNIKENILKNLGFKKILYSMDDNGNLIPWQGEKTGYQVRYVFSPEKLFQTRSGAKKYPYLQGFFGFGKTDKYFYGTAPADLSARKYASLSTLEKAAKAILDAGYILKSTTGKLEDLRKIAQTFSDGAQPMQIGKTAETVLSVLSFVKPFSSLKRWVIAPAKLMQSLIAQAGA